jgi:tetratricopeptide (TPR) repeat protein
MSETESVPQVLSEYESALEKLESKDTIPTSDTALSVLLIRDELQDILSHRTNLLSAPQAKIEQLDIRLQKQQKLILKLLRLSEWRSRLEPSEKNWWWFFASNWEKWDWLWNGLSIVALTVSLSLVVNTSSKILSGGASSETTLAVFGQAVLTLLAGGGAFTEGGRKAIDKILISLNIPAQFWQELSCGFSWMLMLSLWGVNSYLPTWAIDVNHSGIENFKNGRIESAKGDFEQAIAMRPDYADAYYNLGWLYEEINDLDKAKAQYELAVQIDSEKFIDSTNYLKAINNLGRLYILKALLHE